jgi:hypothetical protein
MSPTIIHAWGGCWTNCSVCPQNVMWSELVCTSSLEGDCLWKQRSSPQVVVRIRLIIMEYSENPQLGWSKLSCDTCRLGSHSTTAVMTSPLADVSRVHGWAAFKGAVDVTWRHCSHHRNTLVHIIICMTSTWIFKGPNEVDVSSPPHPRTETSSFWNVVFSNF